MTTSRWLGSLLFGLAVACRRVPSETEYAERMIVPVGREGAVQELELWRRTRSGRGEDAFEIRSLADVRFVPFLGSRGR